MKKNYLFIALILLLGVIVFLFVNKNEVKAPVLDSSVSIPEHASDASIDANATTIPTTQELAASKEEEGVEEQGRFSGEDDIGGVDVLVTEVTYNGQVFTPSTVNIKSGDIVFFKNIGVKDFWPASNPHPNHTNYSLFDSKGPIASSKTFQFKFTKAGTWGFHDHLNPTVQGVVKVTE